MTAEQVVSYLLEEDGLDFLRESLTWVVQQMMEAEVSELVGAARGERVPEERLTHRNGYRPRRWDTRAGELELATPKLRGSYFPSFLQPWLRSEQALVAVVQQAYVCGVATRRVDQLVESLGLRISRSEVSRVCAGLDEQVEAFRSRPLEGRYPYVWLDAKVEKVRDGGRVVRKCLVIAHGVHESGRRELIGLDCGEAETEAFWREFLRGLVRRGLSGCQLVVSDAHEGLKGRRLADPARDQPRDRAERPVAVRTPLPLTRLARPAPRKAEHTRRPGGGAETQRRLSRRPCRRSYTTSWT